MNAKLLGAVTAAALLGSAGIASAQGPTQLTDAQLDVVTAGAPTAFASASAMNGNVDVAILLRSTSDTASAALAATNFVETEFPSSGSHGVFQFVVQAGGLTD
jgi:hypothetical protein